MLTMEQVDACVRKLETRFAAAKKSMISAARAYDKVVGNRVSELVRSGMRGDNKPTADELSLCGGKLTLRFCLGNCGETYFQLRSVSGCATSLIADIYGGEGWKSGDYRNLYIRFNWDGDKVREISIHGTAYDIERISMKRVCIGDELSGDGNDALFAIARKPANFARLLGWEEAVTDFEQRVRSFAFALEPIDRVLKRLERRYCDECETTSYQVLARFGMCDGAVTPKPMRLRIEVKDDGEVETNINGTEQK